MLTVHQMNVRTKSTHLLDLALNRLLVIISVKIHSTSAASLAAAAVIVVVVAFVVSVPKHFVGNAYPGGISYAAGLLC